MIVTEWKGVSNSLRVCMGQYTCINVMSALKWLPIIWRRKKHQRESLSLKQPKCICLYNRQRQWTVKKGDTDKCQMTHWIDAHFAAVHIWGRMVAPPCRRWGQPELEMVQASPERPPPMNWAEEIIVENNNDWCNVVDGGYGWVVLLNCLVNFQKTACSRILNGADWVRWAAA